MRIACPSCAAEYEVPTSRLKPGKLVRCARCGTNWLPDPGAESPVPPPESGGGPVSDGESGTTGTLAGVTAMDRLAAAAASASHPPRDRRLIAAWVLTFMVLVIAVGAILGWRETVVRAWPPSSRILPATDASAPQPGQTAAKKPK